MDSGRRPAAYLVGVILIAVGARIALTASLVPQHRFSVGFSSCATRALEPVALAAVAWVLAGMFPAPAPGFHSPANPNRMARRWLFVFCVVIFGIKHFLYAAIIATSIPLWISGHRFWVYFTGIGFIAAALAILVKIGNRSAAFILGVMFPLWVAVLHAPRVAASSHNGDQWSSLFVALAWGGGTWIWRLRPCAAVSRAYSFRSLTRITNFNPDHTSLTAHTFTSTSPASNPIRRTSFSFISVLTPEVFFGHETQSIPAGASRFAIRPKDFFSSTCFVANTIAKSRGSRPSGTTEHPARASFSSVFTSAGRSVNVTRNPGLIPSFLGRGVPE